MKRVILIITLSYCLGLYCGCLADFNPLYFALLSFFCLLLSIYSYLKVRKAFAFIYLFIITFGMTLSSYKLYMLDEQNGPINSGFVTLHGQISGDVMKYDNMAEYIVYVDNIEYNGTVYHYDYNIKVIDFKNNGGYIVPFNDITISGKFESYKQYKNMYNFYYDRFILKNGAGAVMVADYVPGITSSPSSRRIILHAAYDFREGIQGIIDRYLSKESSAMMKGVLFGDTSSIGTDDIENFKKSGIIHIFAVSGFNIWLLYSLVSCLLFFMKKYKKLKTFLIIGIIGFYTLMSGAAPSVVRAFIMVGVLLLGKLVNKKSDPLTSLSLAAFLILLLNPLYIIDLGFQLSFISVASLTLIFPYFKRLRVHIPEKVKDMTAATLSVQIGIMPVLLYYFNNFPILSIMTNLIIVPLVSLFMIIGILLLPLDIIWNAAALFAGSIINIIGGIIIDITGFISSIPYSNLNVISPNLIEIASYYIIILFGFRITRFKSNRRKLIISSAIMMLIISIGLESLPGDLKIFFIDVGQGDSILIRTPDKKNILIDGGGKSGYSLSAVDIGEDVVKPFLYRMRVDRIDVVVSTHSHEDHLNGLIPVLSSFNTGLFVKTGSGNQEPYDIFLGSGLINRDKIVDVWAGDCIEAGKDVKLFILGPAQINKDDNDSSLVLKLVYKDFSALFTGDVSSKVEEEMLNFNLKSDILKVPHHGSAASLCTAFLDAVKPEAAVICVGINSFGHPSDAVIKELECRGVKLFRTDEDGETEITTSGEGFMIRTAM